MTTINVRFLKPDGVTLAGTLVTSGQVLFSVANRVDTAGGEMLPVPLATPVNTLIVLAPGPYRAEITIADGGTRYTEVRYVQVPATGTVDIEALVELDPASLTPSTPMSSTDHDALVALQAQVAAMSGGASTLAAISNMSPFMRTVNTAVDAPSTRTAIGAADDTAVVKLAATQTITAVHTYSASPVVPTPTTGGQSAPKSYVDGLLAGGASTLTGITDMSAFMRTTNTAVSAAAARTALGISDATTSVEGIVQLAGDLAGTAAAPTVPGLAVAPWYLDTVAGVYPARPATPRHVIFNDPLVTPTLDGVITGGGGMVIGLDLWAGS